MQHQPAPTATDIELMLTRPKPALTLRPLDVQSAPVADAPHYTPLAGTLRGAGGVWRAVGDHPVIVYCTCSVEE